MPANPSGPTPNDWWDKLVVSLELADLNDPATRERLDSAAAKANNQGIHLAAGWQYGRALPMLTAAIDVWHKLGQIGGAINAYNVRGAVYRKIGDYPAAQADHREALVLATSHATSASAAGAINARIGLALAVLEQGELDQAERLAHEAVQQSQSADDSGGAARAQYAAGRVYETRKEWDTARGAFEEARLRWQALQAPAEQIEAAAGLARAALGRGYMVDALALAEQIFQHLAEHGPARLDEPLRVYWTLYRVLHTVRDTENAREILRAANMLMLRQMEGLSPEQRERFRTAVPLHRQIAETWTAVLTAQAEDEEDDATR